MFTLHKIVITTGVALMLCANPAISCESFDANSDSNSATAVISSSDTPPVPTVVTHSTQSSEAGIFCFYEENADKPYCNN